MLYKITLDELLDFCNGDTVDGNQVLMRLKQFGSKELEVSYQEFAQINLEERERLEEGAAESEAS